MIVIHLGKNPKKGGNPPKDMKLINNEILIVEFKLIINNWLIKYVFNKLNIIHKILIKKEYIIK